MHNTKININNTTNNNNNGSKNIMCYLTIEPYNKNLYIDDGIIIYKYAQNNLFNIKYYRKF